MYVLIDTSEILIVPLSIMLMTVFLLLHHLCLMMMVEWWEQVALLDLAMEEAASSRY